MNLALRLTICGIALLAFTACGYQFQGRRNPLQQLGVEKIYVMQFRNSTFRPGIEQLFSTAMIREIQKSRNFELVNSVEEADAVLSGEVEVAEAAINSTKSLNVTADQAIDVATEFNSGVNCRISLQDRRKRTIFSQSVTGNKIFPGASNKGEESATNALVNDSEQRLAIQFLASQMMASVYQRMIDTF